MICWDEDREEERGKRERERTYREEKKCQLCRIGQSGIRYTGDELPGVRSLGVSAGSVTDANAR